MTATVLAIDDSPDVLALLAVRLRPEDITLATATSYAEGLSLALSTLPDLILLDVDMPEHSGLDLCRRLKEEATTRNIPVIFLTGSTDIETKVHGFDLGAVDYVTKPFHPAELRARVRAALRMKRAQDLLTERIQIDALTSLRNRSFFDERLALEVESHLRRSKPLSLVLFDLDHFKRLNDDFGHPFGDNVLQRVGDLIVRSVRSNDAPCRYGGEELALILPDTQAEEALLIGERICTQIRALAFAPRGNPVVVTSSAGVAQLFDIAQGDTPTAAALIEAADQALYAAKATGRDRVRLHEPVLLRAVS